MLVAIASSSNLFLQIKDVLSKLDINSGTLEADTTVFSHSVPGSVRAGEEAAL